MNILNALEKKIGETTCICCSKKFEYDRPDSMKIGKFKDICSDCILSYRLARYVYGFGLRQYACTSKNCDMCHEMMKHASYNFNNKKICRNCLTECPQMEEIMEIFGGNLDMFINTMTIYVMDDRGIDRGDLHIESLKQTIFNTMI